MMENNVPVMDDWGFREQTEGDTDFVKIYGCTVIVKVPTKFLRENGILKGQSTMLGDTYEYGEYPQDLVDQTLRHELERKFHEKQLGKSGKEYTIPDGWYALKGYPEYVYQGKRFIRVQSPRFVNLGTSQVPENSPVWLEVKPIQWRNGNAFVFPIKDVCASDVVLDDNREAVWDWLTGCVAKEIMPLDSSSMPEQEQSITTPSRKRGYDVEDDSVPMTITDQIEFYVRTGKTFMLHGPSGVGKSRRVEDVDPNLTAVPLWNGVLPEDIVGKVRYSNGEVRSAVDENGDPVSVMNGGVWVAPEWYEDLCRKCKEEPDKMHVLFIDEVTNARPATQSLIFNIALRKSISANNGNLPPNSVVVLAGNSKEESGAAYNMPEPLFRRMAAHIYLRPDVTEWLEWGSRKSRKHPENPERLNIHPAVAAFVASHGKECFYMAFDEDAPKLAMDPRGWEQVSDIIYDNGGRIRRELIANKLGKELTAAFIEFAKNPPITAEEIIMGQTDGLPIPQRPDEKMALIYGLRHVDKQHVQKIRTFVYRYLKAEAVNIFDAVWSKGNKERMRFIAQLKAKSIESGMIK